MQRLWLLPHMLSNLCLVELQNVILLLFDHGLPFGFITIEMEPFQDLHHFPAFKVAIPGHGM